MSRVLIGLLVLSSAACAEGPDLHGCRNVGDVDAAVAVVTERWPELAEVAARMDVFCVTQEQIESVSRCGLARAHEIEACTMWLGNGPYAGRMYVVHDEAVDTAIFHEAQHWHLWGDTATNACESHLPDCGWVD